MRMEEKRILLRMLRAFLEDIKNLQHLGAGYYTCAPFIERYNKLLEKAKIILGKKSLLLETFNPLGETRAVDPADKMKVLQKVMIEVGQLIAFIEASLEEK